MPSPDTKWEELVTKAMGSCVDVFGEDPDNLIQITHAGGSPYSVDGIFDSESIEVDPNTGIGIISNKPVVAFAVADLQALIENSDLMTIRGLNYRVKEANYDGQGTVTVMLFRVA